MKKPFVVLFCIFICFSGCIDLYDFYDEEYNNNYNYSDDNFTIDYDNYDNNNDQISKDNNYNTTYNTSNNKIYSKTDYYNKPYNWEYDYDKPYLNSMIEGFKEASSKKGYSDYDTVK